MDGSCLVDDGPVHRRGPQVSPFRKPVGGTPEQPFFVPQTDGSGTEPVTVTRNVSLWISMSELSTATPHPGPPPHTMGPRKEKRTIGGRRR